MSNDLSHLPRVKPDQGKAQWVEAKCTGIDESEPIRTHTFGVPLLMPCTTIFVHGVNSEGEWYDDAMKQFCRGLNVRLGRTDLKEAKYDDPTKRFFPRDDKGRLNSPIIPFYWGYSVPVAERLQLDQRPDVQVDMHGNPLRKDGTWGGGPFQNGTTSLTSFWSKVGFRKDVLFGGIADSAFWNPVIGRVILDVFEAVTPTTTAKGENK